MKINKNNKIFISFLYVINNSILIMKTLKYSAVKSLIYILIFAGLLKVSGLLLEWIWNDYFVYNYGAKPITFLEAAGILAFLYLVYAGVKFGFDNLTTLNNFSSLNFFNQKEKSYKDPNSDCDDCNKYDSSFIMRSKFMSADEKERLREALAKCCGMTHHSQNNFTTQKIQIQRFENEKIK